MASSPERLYGPPHFAANRWPAAMGLGRQKRGGRAGGLTLIRATLAPMTTGSRPAPYRIPLRFRGKAGLILLDRLRTLDKQRLVRRLGAVTGKTLELPLDALRERFEE